MKKIISLVLLISLCACSTSSTSGNIEIEDTIDYFKEQGFIMTYTNDQEAISPSYFDEDGKFTGYDFKYVRDVDDFKIRFDKEYKDEGYTFSIFIFDNVLYADVYYDEAMSYTYVYKKGDKAGEGIYLVFHDYKDGYIDCASKAEKSENVCKSEVEMKYLKKSKKAVDKELKKIKYSDKELFEFGKEFNKEVIKKQVKDLQTADYIVNIYGDNHFEEKYDASMDEKIIISHNKNKITKITDEAKFKVNGEIKEDEYGEQPYSMIEDKSKIFNDQKGIEYSYEKQGDIITVKISIDFSTASEEIINEYNSDLIDSGDNTVVKMERYLYFFNYSSFYGDYYIVYDYQK